MSFHRSSFLNAESLVSLSMSKNSMPAMSAKSSRCSAVTTRLKPV